jgi:hypothetical protein
MRIRLLSLASVAAAALFGAVATAGATAPGSSYQWQQPGCAPVTTPCAQPQASSTPVTVIGLRYTSLSHYLWTQPGTAPVNAPDAQPW